MTGFALHLQLFCLILVLSIISLVDIKTQTIPNSAVVFLGLAGLCFQWLGSSAFMAIASVGFYFGCFWLIRTGHHIATGRIGLGFGDVKMAGAAGAWISIGAAPWFIGLAAMTALTSISFLALAGGASVLKRRIPFGPHLAVSLLVCWVLQVSNVDLNGIYDGVIGG